MGRYFDITTPAAELPLDAARTGVATFTVSNATPSTIGGQAVIDPGPGAEPGWFAIERPGRSYPPQHSESIAVTLTVPAEAAPGRYGFVLRVLLAGGVPEEDFDDSPLVTFTVPEPPPPPPPTPPPPPRKFPWWIVIVAAVIALIAIVAIVAFIVTRPPATPTPPPATPTPPPATPAAQPAGPDLTLRNLIGSENEPIVSVEIANVGDQPAGPFNLAFTVTRIGSGLSPFVINQPFAGLGPGQFKSTTFDSEVFGRPILVLATVDTANTVAESNEGNNTVQSQF